MPITRLMRSNRNFSAFLVSRGTYGLAASALPALLAVSVITKGHGVSDLAFVLGIGALPAVAGALFSPALLRRFSQKSVFQATCLIWSAITLAIAVVELVSSLPLWGLIGVSFLLELVTSTLYPAVGAYLPQLVEKSQLQEANAQRSVVMGTVAVAGPIFISPVAALGLVWQAWLALSMAMIVAFYMQSRLPSGHHAGASSERLLDALASGWEFFRRSPGILTIVCYSCLWHLLGWSAFMVAGPWLLEHEYGALWAWGLIEGVFAAGLILGGMLAPRIKGPTGTICISSLFPLLILLLGLTFHWPIWLLICLGGLTGMMLTVGGVHWSTRIQQDTPSEMIAPVFSLDYLFSEGIAPLGYLLMPFIIAALTLTPALLLVSVGCLTAGALAILMFPSTFAAPSSIDQESSP